MSKGAFGYYYSIAGLPNVLDNFWQSLELKYLSRKKLHKQMQKESDFLTKMAVYNYSFFILLSHKKEYSELSGNI